MRGLVPSAPEHAGAGIRRGTVALADPGLQPLKAWLSLIGWTILPLAGALVLFQRQDLSKE